MKTRKRYTKKRDSESDVICVSWRKCGKSNITRTNFILSYAN